MYALSCYAARRYNGNPMYTLPTKSNSRRRFYELEISIE